MLGVAKLPFTLSASLFERQSQAARPVFQSRPTGCHYTIDDNALDTLMKSFSNTLEYPLRAIVLRPPLELVKEERTSRVRQAGTETSTHFSSQCRQGKGILNDQ